MEKRRTKIMVALAMLICCMCLSLGGGKEVQAAATYGDMTLGQWVKSTITKDVETRYYEVTLPSSGYFTLNVNTFFVNMNYYLYTEDLSKKLIYGKLYGASASNPHTVEKSLWLEKGTYYVRVSTVVGYGDFWVKASFRAAGNNEIEPNNTYASANTLKLNQEVRGLISEQDSDDYYSFTITKPQKIALQIKCYKYNTYVQVRNADLEIVKGKQIWTGSEANPNVYKEDLDLKAGKYYIHIYGGLNGYYDLVVKPSTTLASKVALNRKSASIYKGSTVKLSATVSPSNTTNKKVTWSSSNSQVAKVSSAGVVTGVKAGTAKITARTADGTKITASCTVTVKNKTLTVNRSKATLVKGKYCKLTVKGSPTVSAAAKTVKFSTSNSRIATVTSTGKIIAKKAGTCKIYVKGNGITRTVTVTVKNR